MYRPTSSSIPLREQYKDELKARFNQWYANQVAEQLDEIEDPLMTKVKVNTNMSVIKPLHATWLIDVHQQMSSRSDLSKDEFIKEGILKE